jgi:Flp pilus assembly protein TadD
MTKVQNKKTLSRGKRRVYWWLAAILILTAVVYFRTIYNDFTFWDDPQQVRENTEIRALTFENIKIMFSRYYVNMYQPLTTLSFAVEYRFFGLNSSVFHATNLVLHLVNVALVFFLVMKLSKRKEIALIAACLFGIHPMHVESVAWITERKDVLYALFYFSALIFYLRSIDEGKRKYFWFAFLFFILSCFTKSAAVTLPLVVVLIDWYKQRKFDRQLIIDKIPFFALAFLFGIISILSQISMASGNTMGDVYSIYQRPFLAIYAIVFYLSKFVAPIHLSALHMYLRTVEGNLPSFYYYSLIPFLILSVIIWRIKVFKKEILFGVGFYLAAIILNLHFIPVGSAIASERYAYIPYIGLYLIIGYVYCYAMDKNFMNLRSSRKFRFGIGLIIVCVFGYLTMQRVGVWKDTITLFEDARTVDGETSLGNEMLASGYTYVAEADLAEGNIYKAIQGYSKAVICYSDFHRAWYSRGVAKARLGDAKGAVEDITQAISKNSLTPTYYNDRGNARIEIHDTTGAIEDYTKSVILDPKFAEGYANRARIYFLTGKQTECCRDLMKADSLGYKDAARLLKEHCR